MHFLYHRITQGKKPLERAGIELGSSYLQAAALTTRQTGWLMLHESTRLGLKLKTQTQNVYNFILTNIFLKLRLDGQIS